jgi:NitT/TauT family transport system substrate-binding protein
MTPRISSRLAAPLAAGLLVLASLTAAAESFRLGNNVTLINGLVTLALSHGDFKAQGLDFVEVPLATGPDGLKELQAGRVDAYTISDVSILSDLAKEPRLRILASLGEWDNETRLLVRRDRGIAKEADLAGKRIGVQKGTAFHFFLDRLLARSGLTEADITPVFMHSKDQPAALARGDIDALVGRDPFLGQAEALLGANTRLLDTKGLMVKRFILVTREDILRQRGSAFIALFKALYQAEQRARADLAGTVAALCGPLKEAPASLRAQLAEARLSLSLDDHLLYSLEKAERWQRRLKGETGPASNFLGILDEGPLRAAKPAGVNLNR